MVKKVKKLRNKAQKQIKRAKQAVTDHAAAAAREADGTAGEPRPLSKHAQKKLLKKASFIDRVASTRADLAVKADIKKKKSSEKLKRRRGKKVTELADLSALSESLEDIAQGQLEAEIPGGVPKGLGKGGAKARKKLLMAESARLQEVMNHPSFMADPFTAVRKHLEATMPRPEETSKALRDSSEGGKADEPAEEGKKKKKKKKDRKQNADESEKVETMEIEA